MFTERWDMKTVYQRYDAGVGSRKWDTADCTVRALAKARGMSYNEAWSALYDLQARHKTCSFRIADFLRREPAALGAVGYVPCKAVKGFKRITSGDFARMYPKGKFILRMAHHVAAVVDGVLYDTWDSSRKCCYGAWQIK